MNLNKLISDYDKINLPEDLKGKILSFIQVNENMFPGHMMDKKLFYACLEELGGAEEDTYYTIENTITAGAENSLVAYINEVKKFCKSNKKEITNYFEAWFNENYGSGHDYLDEALEMLDTYTFYDKEEGETYNDEWTIAYCYMIQKTAPMFKNKEFDPELFFDFCTYFDGRKYSDSLMSEAYYWIYYFCIEGACWEFEDLSFYNKQYED